MLRSVLGTATRIGIRAGRVAAHEGAVVVGHRHASTAPGLEVPPTVEVSTPSPRASSQPAEVTQQKVEASTPTATPPRAPMQPAEAAKHREAFSTLNARMTSASRQFSEMNALTSSSLREVGGGVANAKSKKTGSEEMLIDELIRVEKTVNKASEELEKILADLQAFKENGSQDPAVGQFVQTLETLVEVYGIKGQVESLNASKAEIGQLKTELGESVKNRGFKGDVNARLGKAAKVAFEGGEKVTEKASKEAKNYGEKFTKAMKNALKVGLTGAVIANVVGFAYSTYATNKEVNEELKKREDEFVKKSAKDNSEIIDIRDEKYREIREEIYNEVINDLNKKYSNVVGDAEGRAVTEVIKAGLKDVMERVEYDVFDALKKGKGTDQKFVKECIHKNVAIVLGSSHKLTAALSIVASSGVVGNPTKDTLEKATKGEFSQIEDSEKARLLFAVVGAVASNPSRFPAGATSALSTVFKDTHSLIALRMRRGIHDELTKPLDHDKMLQI